MTSDPCYIRIIVYALTLLQVCQTAADTLSAQRALIHGWGDQEINLDTIYGVTNDLLPLVDALCGSVVQYYYMFRIWAFVVTFFGPRMKMVAKCACILTALLPLLSSGSMLAFVIIFLRATTGSYYFAYVLNVTMSMWSISSAVTDAVITTCMIAILYHAKSAAHFSDTRSRIDKILRATLQTGFLTTLLVILNVILLIGVPVEDQFYIFSWYLLGKSYVISFLSILNARTPQNSVIRGSGFTTTNRQPVAHLSTLAFASGHTPVSGNIDQATSGNNRGR